MRILVTGGRGFIGSYVCETLVARGHDPLVLDRRRPAAGHELPWEVFYGDVRDAGVVHDAVAHSDGVIHLAGILGTQETIRDPRPAAETNVLGGLNVLMSARHYELPVVNIGVGNWWMENTYSISKHSVARFAEMMRREFGCLFQTVRALNAYGPRQEPVAPWGSSHVRKVMPSFICRALDGLPIEVYGDGRQVMDMVWVGDVAEILVRTLEQLLVRGSAFDEVIDAGTGRHTTVLDVALAVAQAVGGNCRIETLPMRPGETTERPVVAETENLGLLGMCDTDLVSLEDGLEPTVHWYRRLLGDRLKV